MDAVQSATCAYFAAVTLAGLFFGVPSAHVCIVLAFAWAIAKVSPAIDYLLGRSAADSQLQAAAGNEIRGAGVLGHVVRVFIPQSITAVRISIFRVFAPTAASSGNGDASCRAK